MSQVMLKWKVAEMRSSFLHAWFRSRHEHRYTLAVAAFHI